MRKVLRNQDNVQYWDDRWANSGVDKREFSNLEIYPIRYAEAVVGKWGGRILEIGCGPGRIVHHYARRGCDIVGIERSEVAVRRVKEASPDTPIEVGDALSLPYPDATFDIVMAFGVYHNIENGMEQALKEASRVLRPGGHFVISMRPDNFEMYLNEVYWRWRNKPVSRTSFHKWLVRPDEFNALLSKAGLRTTRVDLARNMSILYRFPFLRQAAGSESEQRARGYQLNPIGRGLDRALRTLSPFHFSNVLVFEGEKNG